MLPVIGFGINGVTITNKLYALGTFSGITGVRDYDYVFIRVPEPCTTKEQVFQKYLQGHEQLAFKIGVNMPNGIEVVPAYGTIADYGVRDSARIWVRLNKVDGFSPISLAALDYLRERPPAQAYPGYDVSDESGSKTNGRNAAGFARRVERRF